MRDSDSLTLGTSWAGRFSVSKANRGAIAVSAIGLAAFVMAIAIYWVRANAPITGDGARILNERLPLSVSSVFRPFHAHLNAVPILLWDHRASSELLLMLLGTHLALATGSAALLVSRLGPGAGFAVALPLALFGSAHFDLLMPWQIVFSLPLLCGLAATWLSLARTRTPMRSVAVGLLLVLSIASSNVGLFLILALAIWFALDRRVRQSWELVPAVAVWVVWFVAFGRFGMAEDGLAPSLAAIPYAFAAMSSGVGGVLGLGPVAGFVAIIAGGAYVVARRPSIHPALLAFALALFAMFMVLSAFRANTPLLEQATTSRYIYLVGYFLAFGLAAAAPRLRAGPWLVGASVIAAALNLTILYWALPTYA
jgi:hypothetical protein